MTLQTFSLISLGIGLLAYLALTIFCVVTWMRAITGRAAFAAASVSLLFLLSLALTGLGPISLSLEVASLLCWTALLLRVIGVGPRNARNPELRPVVTVFVVVLALGAFAAAYPWALAGGLAVGYELPVDWLFAVQLLLAIGGLVLLEQVVRNTRDDFRWRLRYLNIGIGTLFVFQLVDSALALMLGAYVPALLAVQPAIYALAAPFIAVASVRNPANPLRLNLSRQFVFRGGTLVASGLVLLLLGLLGYLVQAFGGDWGAAALALVTAVIAVGTVTLLGSATVRMRTRQLIEEHLFAHKYDYREEWRRVTAQLTEPSPDYDLPQQVLRALGRVLNASGGAVWRLSEQGVLVPSGRLHTPWDRPLAPATSATLRRFFEDREWILDLDDLPEPARELPAQCPDLAALPGVRYLVPLMSEARFSGLAALTAPPAPQTLDWEDYDVIKLIARQGAAFIALREAERELADAEKLRSYNQVSAFVVHDVKTIASQLSLLCQNAARHKQNPAFIDDMVATVENAVERMQKLLAQLRGGDAGRGEVMDLGAALSRTVESFRRQSPTPGLCLPDTPVNVVADPSKLGSAVGHVIQNAIDAANLAAGRGGCRPRVSVALAARSPWAEIVVEDSGPGMDARFIDTALFQPFTSTKGVAGMGIGAFQARAYVRSLGGDVSVESRPGHGARFTIRLPLEAAS